MPELTPGAAAKQADTAAAHRLLAGRRSVRAFLPEPVPAETVRELIACAATAPSACDRQDWRFIVIDDTALLRNIVDAGGAAFIARAPCAILVTYGNATRNTTYRDDTQSAAAAVQNLLLAAHARGLGACWVCHLPDKAFLRRLLGIPRNYSPVACVVLGRPAREPKEVPRRHTTEAITGLNRFPPAGASPPPLARLWAERLAVGLYRMTPPWLKRSVLNRIADARFTRKFDN